MNGLKKRNGGMEDTMIKSVTRTQSFDVIFRGYLTAANQCKSICCSN